MNMYQKMRERQQKTSPPCLLMKPESLAAIANAVEARLNCDFNYWGFEAPVSLYRELNDCRFSYAFYAKFIFRKLYTLNIRACNNGNVDPVDEDIPDIDWKRYVVHHPPEYQEHGFAIRPWHYQLAMLLDYWLCQTSADVTCNDPLRLAMEEFRDTLYRFIVQNNPYYNSGQWGEPLTPNVGASTQPKYIVLCYPSQAVGMIADLGNGPATENGDRRSQYFTIAKGRQHLDRTVSVELIENVNGIPKGDGYYTLHLIDDVSDSPCELYHTDDLSEDSLIRLLKEILANLEKEVETP